MVNLVGNSLKFRRPDVPPQVARLGAGRIGDEWEISCADNGIGIEPEFADKIFVIFQRLHAKDAYPGTGIGLAIVKKIVEYHGGRVWVDTDVAEGTAIRFTLPVLVEDGARRGGAGRGAPDRRTTDTTPDADRRRAPTDAGRRPGAGSTETQDADDVKEVAA